MNLDTFVWRSRILKAKFGGDLPGVPAHELTGLLSRPFESWNSSWFAIPLEQQNDGLTLYSTGVGQFYGRTHERQSLGSVAIEEICSIYQRNPVVIRRGDVVLDLGAHVGMFTRVALDAGASRVIAFEAEPTNARCFRKTFARELSTGSVVLVDQPVWDKPCTVRFSGHGLVGQIGSIGESRQAVVIDDVVRELQLERVDFIKTDIEGAERQALRGASGVLSEFAPRLAVSTYHYPDDPDVLRELVLEYHGYSISFDKGQKRMFCI